MVSIPNTFITTLLLPPLTVTFIIFLTKWLWKGKQTPRRRPPPSPRKLPFIGNLHQLIGVLPHEFLHALSKQYGKLMLLHLGRVPVLVASSPEAAREIVKNQDLIFARRPKLSIADKLFYGSTDLAFSPCGDYWNQVKTLILSQVLSKKRVQSFRRVREEETSLMIDRIGRLLLASSSSVVNLTEVLFSVPNDIICRAALGRKYDDEGKAFTKLVRDFFELLGLSNVKDFVPWLGWIDRVSGMDLKAERVFKRFDEFLDGVVEEHVMNRAKKSSDDDLDFVDILLDHHKGNEQASLLTRDSVKALTLDMFVGGSDTILSSLIWTMAELVRTPETMQKLQREVREIAKAKKKNEITEDDLDNMHYMRAAIKESLRLHPPAPLLVPHASNQDTKVLGYDIPKGTVVMINAWAMGRDPSLWEDPERFDPERFLNSELDYRGHHFEFIPFGSGRRSCPAMTYAENVMEITLAKLVHKFDFALPDGESLDMGETNGLTVHKRIPLRLVVTPHAF